MSEQKKSQSANLLESLIKSVNENTTAIKQCLVDLQANAQIQGSTDRSVFKDVGSNKVNVFNYIDPDTVAGALANNEAYVLNLAEAISAALSVSLIAEFKKFLEQSGLINIGVQ